MKATWQPTERPGVKPVGAAEPQPLGPPASVGIAPPPTPGKGSGTVAAVALDPPSAPGAHPGTPVHVGSFTPVVRSYAEQTMTWKAGDSFAAISKNEYRSESYAAALEKFNRQHPRASDGMSRGTPQPGDKVFLPPLAILEGGDASVTPKPLNPGPAYKVVKDSGDSMYEIARVTLNNSARWMEIRQLNPHLNPERPVPVGTVLHLPAEAQVPPENRAGQ